MEVFVIIHVFDTGCFGFMLTGEAVCIITMGDMYCFNAIIVGKVICDKLLTS
ncbi:hypothetical protein BIFGAL_03297 [Bifidobacterium gallicum DSM 20093 = LMG 11596]|uniref:Uncharacterized protein n=1 Tax=Bifidobacterium gallicum DSM 20093 = LMG 11596 TaxID=561180 RepID=D1NTX6_9BIFI|nr:hypothetical protein BIFGAL_03297 [Bifidobacterium gallicum DSM 20093 = LMG 11596]